MSISTHILDVANGKPASGIRVRLFFQQQEVGSGTTDQDGRIPMFLSSGAFLRTGIYRLEFDTGAYFPQGFYPMVSISFHVQEEIARYHVPLLISPFGFTTYRGS